MPGLFRAFLMPAAVAAALSLPNPAAAQNIEITAPSRDANAAADAGSVPGLRPSVDAEPPLDDETLARALTFDPLTLTRKKPAPQLRRKDNTVSASWSRTPSSADGSSVVQVKKPIPASEWNATIGGELAIAGAAPAQNEYDRPLPGTVKDPRAGAAWASVEVPDLATVEVRVAPSADQRMAGASLQRTLPIGSYLSVKLENRVTVTETLPGGSGMPAPPQAPVWGNERSLKLNVVSTGTTLAAAATTATDPALNSRTFSADQKIYGPLHVTTAVTNPGQPNASKSIGAGLKFAW